MYLQPLSELNWAYQLHYYICFRTHRRKEAIADKLRNDFLTRELSRICEAHDYHLLRSKAYPEHVRCLLSLRPSQDVSTAVKAIKGGLSREFCSRFGLPSPLWARGFLARGVGRVRIDAVKNYLDHQAEHHGYASRTIPPVFRFRADKQVILGSAHSSFDLNHHLVLGTRYRRGVFGSEIGEALVNYWLAVAEKKGFAVDRATVLPDHVHMLVRTVPKMGIEAAAFALMNNAQHWIGRRFPQMLLRAGIDQLWQPSAYAGSRGKVTTALVKSFLSQGE